MENHKRLSIQAASDDEKAELGTPILTYEDIPDLQEILRQLRHKGANIYCSYPYEIVYF